MTNLNKEEFWIQVKGLSRYYILQITLRENIVRISCWIKYYLQIEKIFFSISSFEELARWGNEKMRLIDTRAISWKILRWQWFSSRIWGLLITNQQESALYRATDRLNELVTIWCPLSTYFRWKLILLVHNHLPQSFS